MAAQFKIFNKEPEQSFQIKQVQILNLMTINGKTAIMETNFEFNKLSYIA